MNPFTINEDRLIDFCIRNRSTAKEILMNLRFELCGRKNNVPVRDAMRKKRIARSHNVLFNNSIVYVHSIQTNNLEKIVKIMSQNIA